MVREWAARYRESVAEFRDADGRSPQHTFFYPQEQYDPQCVDPLAELCAAGFGEVEVHLHHRDDTAQGLRDKLTGFRDTLRARHGLLGSEATGRVRFGFIHGNWALCNSRPDGDWCGVNQELGVLKDTGCYADFTFPSAPSPTQPGMVNAIYYARDAPNGPRGHDRGVRVAVRAVPPQDSLLLVTGPLACDWRRRKWGILPRLENGDLTAANPPTPERVGLWARQYIHVIGRPEWVFVKVYTHGCIRENTEVLLGKCMDRVRHYVQNTYNDLRKWTLHYVTAREMYNVIKAAEAGLAGDPGQYRDHEIQPPPILG